MSKQMDLIQQQFHLLMKELNQNIKNNNQIVQILNQLIHCYHKLSISNNLTAISKMSVLKSQTTSKIKYKIIIDLHLNESNYYQISNIYFDKSEIYMKKVINQVGKIETKNLQYQFNNILKQ
ncbi:unnamed protein product [Paramecium octaurelia]|uniref:Uncharacterized protein n=1 Tax=Paramecium octaurelia TaxID=43137 RepID=A0A8S1X362_PAROT|nr:unnamed protein product [Paramecium octaurelia]